MVTDMSKREAHSLVKRWIKEGGDLEEYGNPEELFAILMGRPADNHDRREGIASHLYVECK